ncbi:MAG: hypothetical protein U0736_22890 [Gemmataceae bacterium]
MSNRKRWLSAVLAGVLALTGARAGEPDLLDGVKERLKIEAQRVEREFAEGRAAAYRLVRTERPRPDAAVEKLEALLAMVRTDTALDAKRRELLLVTLRYDLDRVREIANTRQTAVDRRNEAIVTTTRDQVRRADTVARTDGSRTVSDQARAIIESRSKTLADARGDRLRSGEGRAKLMRSVDEAAVPEAGNIRFPDDWVEKSKRRSPAMRMTAKERALMKSLSTQVDVDFSKNTLDEVLDYLRKSLKVEIAVDKRALEEANVTYESQVNLKLRGSARTVLKRVLGDLNLAYVVKDEAIQITSRERAAQMTTTRAYYIGDLAPVLDFTLPPAFTQLAMMETVNRIITMITQQVEPQSWQATNPDAVGAIVFDPISMSLVVKQTAEVHFLLGGYR